MPRAHVMHKDVRMPRAHGCAGAAMRRSGCCTGTCECRGRAALRPERLPREKRKNASDLRVRLSLRIARRKRRRRGVVGAPIGIRLGLQRSRILVHACTIVTVHSVFRRSALAEWAAKASAAVGDARSQAPKEQRSSSKRPAPRSPVKGLLTPKEGEVLRLVARNLSNKQIARARRRRRNRQAAREESVQQTQRREARTPRGSARMLDLLEQS